MELCCKVNGSVQCARCYMWYCDIHCHNLDYCEGCGKEYCTHHNMVGCDEWRWIHCFNCKCDEIDN